MNKCAHLFIYGDVIGVGFRAWTLRNAISLGLTGWVKNADDHLVEAILEGPHDKVEEMIERCRKGPLTGWVEKVEVKRKKGKSEFSDFKIV